MSEEEIAKIDLQRIGKDKNRKCKCTEVIPGKTECRVPDIFTTGKFAGVPINVGCPDMQQYDRNGQKYIENPSGY